MTNKERNSIIWSFNSNKTLSYKELSLHYDAITLYYALIGGNIMTPFLSIQTRFFPAPDGSKIPIFATGTGAYLKYPDPKFSDTDIFCLNEYGEDLLYQLQKEKQLEELTSHSVKVAEESLSVAKESTRYARLAFYAAVIFGLLSLALSAKEELWHWLQLASGLSL